MRACARGLGPGNRTFLGGLLEIALSRQASAKQPRGMRFRILGPGKNKAYRNRYGNETEFETILLIVWQALIRQSSQRFGELQVRKSFSKFCTLMTDLELLASAFCKQFSSANSGTDIRMQIFFRRSRDILVRIRNRGSMPLTSRSRSGSGSCYFRH